MQENKKVIYADDLLSSLRDDETIDGAHFKRVKQHINAAPAVDAVSRGLFEQYKWERDIAIGQLADYGVSLGEKADVYKVVHGKWEEDEPPKHYIFTGVDVIYRCSECNNRFVHDTHYCPNCGAKMDGDGNV